MVARQLRLANGGCPYRYYYRAVTGVVEELEVDAYPLGVQPATSYGVVEMAMEPGDCVQEFAGAEPQADDQTIGVLKVV